MDVALKRRGRAIPSADIGGLRDAGRRARLVRLALALALAGALAAAILLARDLQARQTPLFPAGTSGVVVLDLSKSVGSSDYHTIEAVLTRLAATGGPLGLVVFSDVPYELLPPGSPAGELRPLLRFFRPVRGSYPVNPWAPDFEAGTRISLGLALARGMLVRAHAVHGSILLVSDLETASSDLARLTKTLLRLSDSSIAFRAVPLSPLKQDRDFFVGLLGPHALVDPRQTSARGQVRVSFRAHGGAPAGLLVAAGLLLALLAVNELWGGRLALPREEGV